MPEMTLAKTQNGELAGFGADNQRAWEKFKRWWKGLEPGEFFTFSYKQPRNAAFHRKFFALLNIGFDAWEPEHGRKRLKYKGHPIAKSFETYRKDIVILAGYYNATFDLKGRLQLEAKSIAFDKMTEDEFALLYEAVVKVLLEYVLHNYTRDDVDRVVAELERF